MSLLHMTKLNISIFYVLSKFTNILSSLNILDILCGQWPNNKDTVKNVKWD